ncbi:melanoma-associated antigen B2-like [Symsagittifera roscoffensis]|uniref:melanoma-associated antigen B2-like n=1 Tax=Symsagittifera roscoffensis TaxID=84072 RepID=UPI00307B6315
MDGESVSLSSLLTGLQFFGIYENQEHEIYGNIKNLITKKFVKEAYLRIEKEDNNITADERSNVDPYLNAKVFLGNRSLAMVDKKKVLDYVSQVYGNKPEDWVEQFDEFGG